MKLHLNKKLFTDAVKITSEQLSIPPIFIEKDYWVTYALHTVFNNPLGANVVFKGGTALSKCFGLIDRFSEDIDLVLIKQDGESKGKFKSRIREIGKLVSAVLPEIDIEGVTNKFGMIRKTAHVYKKEFEGDFGQTRKNIILEIGWLGDSEPNRTVKISSFIYEMMKNNGQEDIAEENKLLPFNVLVLEPKRTLCEKIMSLVRFSDTENPIEDLKMKVRHTYDLHKLLENKELVDFFNSKEFDELLLKVATGDVESFKNNNEWLQNHPSEAKIFAEVETVWKELKTTYNGDFKNLVFGELPKNEEIFASLVLIKERLTSIEWTINIEGRK